MKRWMNARNGEMLNSIAPMPLGMPTPMHWRKLIRPNTQPMARPPFGPSAIAAMATGMVLSVMTSGPTGMLPIGVNENTITRAVIRPRIARARTSIFLVAVIFSYLLLPRVLLRRVFWVVFQIRKLHWLPLPVDTTPLLLL